MLGICLACLALGLGFSLGWRIGHAEGRRDEREDSQAARLKAGMEQVHAQERAEFEAWRAECEQRIAKAKNQ